MQLGKAAARPFINGFHVAYLLDLSIWTTTPSFLLLETPPSIMNQLIRAKIDVSFIDWIFISHRHGDHLLGLPMILVSEYIKKSNKTWKIIIQEDMKPLVEQLVHIAYPELDEYVQQRCQFFTIPAGREFSMRITPEHIFKTCYGLHGVPSTSIRVEGQDGAVVYSGDTGYADSVIGLAHRADVLIHEIGAGTVAPEAKRSPHHTTATEAGQVAALAQCKSLWLTHMEYNTPDYTNRCRQLVQEHFAGALHIMEDFEWVNVRG